MPLDTSFTTYSNGVLRELCNEVYVSPAIGPNDLGRILIALWDTGATHSFISQRAVSLLDLKPMGQVIVHGAIETMEVNTYKINLTLSNYVQIQDLTVSEIDEFCGDVDFLIGMDIISLGNFVVSTWKEKTSFSFQCPANQRIDLLPMNLRKNMDNNP